ncbi:SCO6745 family protein [Actinomadura macrotermitis]|uniref:SalK n=1 Tax=Actinomadura macrotermitis TaxID=2585200 RepID=A0A7K0BNT7_9ACTN|nr:hypothetical protein [Actinomadura macrotermitis]MQY02841.1 hypothetical protein [Actinomadura macrotermitis]
MDASYARTLWTAIEPIHVVTYFSPESIAANKAVGLRGYWMGYFGSRGAPMGAVAPGVITATFHGFHPGRVRRAIPDAWAFAAPESILEARAEGAAMALRRMTDAAEQVAERATPQLARVVEAADATGRPLFAANREVAAPADPVAALWQATTSLREHRGDGHVAVLTAEGLDGPQANLLAAAVKGTPAQWLQESRGWSGEEWDAAKDALVERGLLDAEGEATEQGRALRDEIEERTDRLAAPPYRVLDDPAGLYAALKPLAQAVADSGDLPFPNPIGLPRLA